ncbi:MAG: PepSY-associated TM helix domain-containing protein, partial [Pseudomonadota bacterium]
MSTVIASKRSLRRWLWVHEWTSLISTIFVLIACITGLPLVFHHELEALFASEQIQAATEERSFDALIEAAEVAHPGHVAQMVLRQQTDPGATMIALGETIDAPLESALMARVANADGAVLDAAGVYDGVLGTITQIHVELLSGQFGMLFLGLMTLLLLVAIISGVVLYAPFMGNRAFATVRDGDVRRRWFDLHNALGMVLALWLFVVSITGAINTIGSPLIQMWLMTGMQDAVATDMAEPIAPEAQQTSFQDAYNLAQQRMPDTDFFFAMFPGNGYSSDRHYLIFNTGRDPLSSRLFKPVIV